MQQSSEQYNTAVQTNVPEEGELREINSKQQPNTRNQPAVTQPLQSEKELNSNINPSNVPLQSTLPGQPDELESIVEEFESGGLQSFAFTNLSKSDTKSQNCTKTRTCTNQI